MSTKTNNMTEEKIETVLDDLMTKEKVETKPLKPKLANIKLDKLHPFENHPYKVVDDDSMTELTQSIAEQGFLNRIIVRPLEDKTDEYEIISGHRRVHAAELLGIKEIPSAILSVDRDEATKLMVDSNIQRENVSIMERGRAYRMKLDAMKRTQGERTDLTCDPLGHKLESQRSVQELADNSPDSKTQIQRYIRLTYLVPELQEFADEGKIKLRPGVELSYLDEEAQRCVVDRIDDTEVFPSHDQARRMRTAFEEGKLDYDAVTEIMNELKPNQVEKLKIPMDDIRKYVPKGMTPQEMQAYLVKLAKKEYDRQHDRGALYCGDVINFKSHSKSFKNKTRIPNPKEEWKVFKDVHEPIIDRSIFEQVQTKVVKKTKRRVPKKENSEKNIFTDFLYCADCGKKLWYHTNTGNKDIHYFSCSNYKTDTRGTCETRHYIRADAVEQIVLFQLGRFADFIVHDEEAFAQVLADKTNKDIASEKKMCESIIAKSNARIGTVSNLHQKLYEDNACGKVTDEWYMELSHKYESERADLKAKITQMKERIDELDRMQYGKEHFIKTVKQFMEMKRLTKQLLHELIDKIVVHETEGVGKNRTQRVEIYWRFVGFVELPDVIPPRNYKQDTRQGVAVEYISA